ncbi:SGNH/GDSL hydrolase family protein [Streptomyces sp. H10-C2]|uniref:SGNH/GDSL hydrolase family protein n=1 Tax=unclassified Streptomyces TaxID=2593676 RepID=UPI0024BB86B1|nr:MULTISPECIES: SGNH/GDSL hydrolase family protein [unclassified Streptomyces]MDJ0345974.1 SGNH/GDSL hydrolase family protein [Streptomyces sp. PH10-H1]MDJ0373859.1 SGNH/GDSL hydrolase family protein [Streptomyces sp. H10-C2]
MACAALAGGLLQAAPATAAPKPNPGTATPPPPSGQVEDPGRRLGKDWKASADRAVTAAADSGGLRILVADSSNAYAWKTIATVAESGLPADSWIGNQCLMDHEHAAVVYAPRSFTNKPDLMQGGAFTAVVNLTTGHVTKLQFTASLAYFDPSCNTVTHTAAFTAFRDMNDPASTRTRVVTVNTAGKTMSTAAAKGEITSAVPVEDGTVAALGSRLIHLDRSGTVKNLADADSVPFDIRPAAEGKVAFVDRKDNSTAHAKVFTGHGKPAAIASGRLGDLELMQGEAGRVFLTGHPTSTPATTGTGVTPVNAPSDTDVSSHGRLAVDPVLTPGVRAGLLRIKDAGKGFTKTEEPVPQAAAGADDDKPTTVTSTATTTGAKLTQSVQQGTADGSGTVPSPALGMDARTHAQLTRAAVTAATAAVSNDPVDTDRWCGVSRNDVGAQALQPTPNQVEWAVDMAVRGNLRSNLIRQGGYRDQAGLGTIDPQGLFAPPQLNGGGKIPANVLLGVMAQESNLWQAESGAIPGQMGNPLAAVDGYYGHKAVDGDPSAYWQINWDKSDCGYGVGQVTDGMRLAGHEKDHETSLSPALQKLVAVDYASNVAASMKILASKWNEVHTDGQKVTVNNDDPAMVENWFTAVWNYNLGFNPPSESSQHGGHWGLGWYNNPANPLYAKSWGHPFMDTSVDGPDANKDAAHPQDWPYEEKVMGWSAWSIDAGFSYGTSGRQDWPGESGFSSAGFRPAWWTNPVERQFVSPPLGVFCNNANSCDPNTPPNCTNEACYAQYWWNQPNVTWKVNCASTCGHENIKYQTVVSEPGRGYRLQNGQPVCSGAPTGSKVVASVPNGTPTWGDCGSVSSAGSFQFAFNPGTEDRYEAKADLHQIGGGYGGHYWYAHTRDTSHLGGPNGYLNINGTWTLGQKLTWARVMVHLPDTGAQTRQGRYVVGGTDSTSTNRIVEQRANRWVSLGVFHFTGTPAVSLSNTTEDGTADEDIAWGAVAFQPLPGKPKNMVVAMGDSYSSGEGASEGNRDYYPETNYRDKKNEATRDACHRSGYAWSRQATLPGASKSTGELADTLNPTMDYHLIACSGARTYNVLDKNQVQKNGGEMAQIEQGYLDANTTLVTISIGGNDARFGNIIQKCLLSVGDTSCKDKTFDDTDDAVGGRDNKFVGQNLETAIPGIINEIVRPDITKTLMAIQTKAPFAKIVLMGYPPLISGTGSCLQFSVIGFPNLGLSQWSTRWLNDTAGVLTTAMQGAADDANKKGARVWFSDPQSDFAGKAVCGDPEQVHGLVKTLVDSDNPAKDWPVIRNYGVSAQSFHPKIEGARLYANSLERTTSGMGL